MTEILVGVVIGLALAQVINQFLGRHYNACLKAGDTCRRCRVAETVLRIR